MQKVSSKTEDESKHMDKDKLKKIRKDLQGMRKINLIHTGKVKFGVTKQIAVCRYSDNPLTRVSFHF